MMQTPDEKVLETCLELYRNNKLCLEIKQKWEAIFRENLKEYSSGEIDFEEYDTILEFAIDLLPSLVAEELLTSNKDIEWCNEHMEMAKTDKVIIENDRNFIINYKRVLDEYPEVFNYYVDKHGKLGKHDIDNGILIGEWESKVRQVMRDAKDAGYSRKAAEIHVAMN